MDKLVDLLNQATAYKYSFMHINTFVVDVPQKTVRMTFLVPQQKYEQFSSEDKTKIIDAVTGIVRENAADYSTDVTFKKSYIDCDVLEEYTINFLKEQNPMLSAELKRSSISATENEFGYVLTVTAAKYIVDSFTKTNLINKLQAYYYRNFTDDVEINCIATEDEVRHIAAVGEIRLNIIKEITVNDVVRIEGLPIKKKATFIKKANKELSDIVLCGRIIDKQRKVSSKEKLFYSFALDDSTDRIRCLYFPKKDKVDQFFGVLDDTEVIMRGAVRADKNSNQFTFWVNDISLCSVDWTTAKDETVYKDEPKEYTRVFPQTYTDSVQTNLFDNSELPTFLKNKEFVVFDFETTGLDTQKDTPIELGALKIVDGVFTESFSTLINPKMSIPDRITELTSITDADVALAPKINEILGDFYKFTRNAELVAHNADFDMAFLKRLGHEAGYNFFDVKYHDTCALARKYLRLGNYKLETVGKYYKLVGKDLHRAFNDVLLTAKIFVKLTENM